MNIKKRIPTFENIEQESDFWDSQSTSDFDSEDVTEDFFEKIKNESTPKKKITLRIEPQLLEELTRLAHEHDIPYQRLARKILWTGISKYVK